MIVNRKSVVAGAGISRSLEERIVEPVRVLCDQGLAEYTIVSDSDWENIDFRGYTHVAMNRPHSHDSFQMATMAKLANVPLLIDIDDLPIYFPEGDSAHLSDEKKRFFMKCMETATVILPSTKKILEWLKKELPSVESIHVPTGLDFDRIDRETKSTHKYSRGILFTNAGSLKLGTFAQDWLSVMEKVLKKTGWRLEVFADNTSYLPDTLPFHYLGQAGWFEHKTAINQAFPLSITPLASSEDPLHLEYSQYKTPIKYITYGGLGIPGIYSDCSIYSDEIINLETGIVVKNTTEAWTEAMERAISDTDLLKKIMMAAKKDVRNRFSIERAARNWHAILSST